MLRRAISTLKTRVKEKVKRKEPSRKKLRQLKRKAELKLHFNKRLPKKRLSELKKLSRRAKETFLLPKLF
tara:strand:- start:386 stop:595 length:210 start_codon:yes stop_codon:yes gene_type:complete